MTKMLLDENLPRPLAKHFSEAYAVSTVSTEGWASKKNGELLSAMTEADFEYLVTADRNLAYQQNLDILKELWIESALVSLRAR